MVIHTASSSLLMISGIGAVAGVRAGCASGYRHAVRKSAAGSRLLVARPVLVVTSYDDPADLVRLANETVHGLSPNIWTWDVAAACRLAQKIKAGTITVNSGMIVGPALPFGGFKQSGWGREGGAEGRAAFTGTKSIITAL